MNTPKQSILQAENLTGDKTALKITCGLRTEMVGYDSYYLTEANAIKAMQLYNRRYVAYLKEKIAKLELQSQYFNP